MEIIHTIESMKNRSKEIYESHQTIGFIPTMGCLHEGHLSLVQRSIKVCDFTVVSIFINPTQFNYDEDFDTYPQSLDSDRKKLQPLGVNTLFIPTQEMMYPEGFKTFAFVEDITTQLCGKNRPTLFRGVITIVLKLFNIVRPHKTFFGEKDHQQLEVIRTLVRDLDLDIEVVSLPIMRESDGLAMSSRNLYLSDKERQSARSLCRALETAKGLVQMGETSSQIIKKEMQKIILNEPKTQIDYISLCDPSSFNEQNSINGKTLIALAVNIGNTRLIDNCIVGTIVCRE